MESISGPECQELHEEMLPSQVKTEPWIQVNSPKKCEYLASEMKSSASTENIQAERNVDIDTCKIGKWLLFNDIRQHNTSGLTQQDEMWRAIRQLVNNNVLFSAKCSTAWPGPYVGKSRSLKAVICCYTPDYTDKQDVKRAADSIREAVHYPLDMYYKTDADTYAGKYRHFGDKAVSMYKHTIDGVMYERNLSKKKWNLLDI